ncbi:MAG: penicillin-binding protein 2 [Actinomycetota bacterium]|nr:penicillin-binding protein 2 [Actinomycetota bacterium]
MVAVDRRIGWIFVAFLSLLGVAVIKAVDLGVLRAGTLQHAAFSQQITQNLIPASRGAITDRNGVELAISQSADEIIADPYLIKQPQATAAKLAPLLGKPVLSVLALVTKPHDGFVPLARLLPADRAAKIMKLQINGISTVPEVTRYYPRSWAASQVLGSVHLSGQGASGLEYRYNPQLRGSGGVRRIVNDAVGQPISIDDVRTMRAGQTVRLTVDAALQDEVEQVLAGIGARYSPKGATAIVMDPNTGGILALANWPRVNANDPGGSPPYATENRAVSFNYEPGSTFKAFTVAGALQDNVVSPGTDLNIPAVLQVADRRIHDAEVHPNETLSVAQILKVSSNIGADEIGMKVGASRFDHWVHAFGFGSPTRVDLPGEQRGIVLHAAQYSGSSMGNLPMGQGESVTPLQMATAYSAIANGGILRAPHVVAAIGGHAQRLPAGHRIISATTAAELRGMLQGVLADGGTASGAGIPGYDLAGKTGTANVVVNGSYSASKYIASFIGMVPASAPKLVVAVMVDQPQGSIYGGSVAAPAFQKIVGWAVPYLGIAPTAPWPTGTSPRGLG